MGHSGTTLLCLLRWTSPPLPLDSDDVGTRNLLGGSKARFDQNAFTIVVRISSEFYLLWTWVGRHTAMLQQPEATNITDWLPTRNWLGSAAINFIDRPLEILITQVN
jgi:hypothetical protein